MDELIREKVRATRRAIPFCVLYLELTGVPAGCSRRRARGIIQRYLCRRTRMTDVRGRLSRDIFAVLFTDTPQMGGRLATERIVARLSERGIVLQTTLKIHDPEAFEENETDHSEKDENAELGDAPQDGVFEFATSGSSDHFVTAAGNRDAPLRVDDVSHRSGDGSIAVLTRRPNRSIRADDSAAMTRSPANVAVRSRTSAGGRVDRRRGPIDERLELHSQLPVRMDAESFVDWREHRRAGVSDAVKRVVDIAGASFGLICSAPVMVPVMAMIWWNDRGNPIFCQTREGRFGRPFTIYKLRTMQMDAESKQDELRAMSHRDGPAFKIQDDPRVTRLGKFLRKSCLDELPQLVNVLLGHMSLVGPRPLPWNESRDCGHWHRRRLQVRPGMTCYWQIEKGRVESFDDWMRLDVAYLASRSWIEDIKLIVRTVTVPLSGRGGD